MKFPFRRCSLAVAAMTVVIATNTGRDVTYAQSQSGQQQDQPKPQTPVANGQLKQPGPTTPVKVQVVISRYQGDRKISNIPFTLMVNANDGFVTPGDGSFHAHDGPARLRTGAQVPIRALTVPKDVSSPASSAVPVTYRDIGTNIDCVAYSTGDGRFRVSISISDTSIYPDGQTAAGAQKLDDFPSIRSFQSSNAVMLKDGETAQFSSWADKISGEVTKVDVTLTVVK